MQFPFCKFQAVLLCTGILFSSIAVNAAVDPDKASRKKFRLIDKIIAGFEVNGEKRFYDPLVQAEIKDAVDQKVPLTPEQKLQQDSWTERNTKARHNVEKANKYDEEALKKEAVAEAGKKYPMDALKSEVVVDYIRGKQGFQAKGKLYQIDTNEGTVKVGNSRIYFADMSKETRSRFDKKTNDQIKQDYVALKLSDKRQEIIQLQKKECEKIEHDQIRANLKNGYLYQNGKWITAEKYVNKKIAAIAKRHKKEDDEKAKLKAEAEQRMREAEAKKAELKKKADEAAAAKAAKDGKPVGEVGDAAAEEAGRTKLLEELSEKQKKIQSSFSGIDAFQGYEKASVWGMQTSEVRQALDIHSENAGVDEDVILNFPEDSMISKVVLHYFDATFRMVETNYKDMNDETFAEFHGNLREQFGLSKTEEASKEELFKLIQENKLSPDKLPVILDPSKDESGAGFAVPKMIDPQAYVFVWDGMMSRGILTFTRNAEKKMYENIRIYRVSLPLRWEEKEREKREAEADKITNAEADKK